MLLQGETCQMENKRGKESNSNKANQMIIITKKQVTTNMTGPS